MAKNEQANQVSFNQPISFNFMQTAPKSQVTKQPKAEGGNVFGFESGSNENPFNFSLTFFKYYPENYD